MAEFTASIEIAAAPEAVFAHLVTDEGMRSWMGQWADLDPSPGGLFAVDIAGFAVRGEFLEVDPPNRVVVSWGVTGSTDVPPGASVVAFTLRAIPGGTRLDLVHSGLPDAAVAGHAEGWAHFLPRLARAVAGEPLPEDTWRPQP